MALGSRGLCARRSVWLGGWKRRWWFRATALSAMAALLVAIYRPAAAVAALPPAPAASSDRASPRVPADGVVPMRLAPTAVELESGAAGAGDPWSLFDGDARAGLQAAGPVRVRVRLGIPRTLAGLTVFGPAHGTFSVLAADGGRLAPIEGLTQVTLSAAPERWTRLSAAAPVRVESLVLEWTPAAPGEALRELEIWGLGAPAAAARPRTTADELLVATPPEAMEALAEPDGLAVMPSELGLGQAATFQVDVNGDPRAFDRAFLVYELAGLPHWSAAIRRINGMAAQGGFQPTAGAPGGVQVEEISPRWLVRGSNQITFLPLDEGDPLGYRVRRVRLIGLPPAPAPLAAPAGTNSGALGALLDGDTATGLPPAVGGARVVDLPFDGPAQLHALTFALAKPASGTLELQAVRDGRPVPGWSATAVLDAMVPGWHQLPLRADAPVADGLRVRWTGAREGSGALAEVRPAASPLPRLGDDPRLTVSYPLHGECVDGAAYLRGFVAPLSNGSGAPAIAVDGRRRADALAADGSFGLLVAAPAADRRWQTTLSLSYPDGEVVSRTLAFDGCAEGRPFVAGRAFDDDGLVDDLGAPFGQVVRAGQAATVSFAGATLEIPAGALERDVRITVRPLAADEVAPLDPLMDNVTPDRRAYRFGPHGLHFKKPVKMTLPYTRGLFPSGTGETDVLTFFHDDQEGRWRAIQRVAKAEGGKLASATLHFTDFINATLAVPDHPTAASFDPNTIKGLRLGDPGAGIDQIGPPTANPTGSANLSYPIVVPPGRQGVQPTLAITYNSEGANGWMGVGWDLAVPSISIDTRFGVPRYGSGNEIYALDGAALTSAAPPPGQSGTFFRHRVEGSFERIERKGNGPGSYTWEVTDKRGTHFFYGETSSSRLASYRTGDVFRWYLERVVDSFGNQMRLRYVPDSGHAGTNASGEQWVQLYPQGIDYTSHTSGSGDDLAARYHVSFVLDDGSRADAISNARGGFDVRTRFRLARVDVSLDDQVIRSYHLGYTTGAFAKSLLKRIEVFGLGGTDKLYEHAFDYFGTDGPNGFGPPVVWGQLPGDANLAESEDDSGGFNAFVGVGDGSCTNHVGVGGGFSAGGDRSKRVFVDVDGDGLPDLIDEGGGVNLNRFAAGTRASGTFVSDFLSGGPGALSHSDQIGVSLTEALHVAGELGGAGLDQSWNWTTEDRGFTDVNGDGFPDIVDASGGSVSAGLSLLGQNQRGFGALASIAGFAPSGDFSDSRANQQLAGKFYPTSPLVKWVAPFQGRVSLTGAITRLGSSGTDGVKASIYLTRTTPPVTTPVDTLLWQQTLAPGAAACTPAPSNDCGAGLTVDVLPGDHFYFKLDGLDDIDGDATTWSPALSYTQLCDGTNPCTAVDHTQRDGYGLPLYDYARDTDFRIADPKAVGWTASFGGTVSVAGTVKRTAASDQVTLRILRNSDVLDEIPLGASDPLQKAISRSIDVSTQDQLTFDLRTASNLDPGRVSFDPVVSYTTLCRDEGAGPICRQVLSCDDTTRRCTLQDPTTIVVSEDIVTRAAEVADTALPVGANEPMAGGFRGWYVAEWNAQSAFGEAKFNEKKSQGQASNFARVLPRRLGIKRDRPLPINVAGPAWMGAGADSYVLASEMKPSRIGGVKAEQAGNAPGLRKSKGFTSGESATLFASVGHSSGDATGLLDFLDLNGDRLPDSISYDQAQFQGPEGFGPGQSLGMTFGSLRAIDNQNIRFGFAAGSAASAVANKLHASGATKAIVSVLPSLGLHYGNAVTKVDFVDVNGDGLPDHVSKNGGAMTVQLNLGYGFGNPTVYATQDDPAWGESVNASTNGTIALEAAVATVSGDVVRAQDNATNSLQIGFAGIGGGMAYSVSRTLTDYVDVNGDGLPDQVLKQPSEGAIKVKINLGTTFAPPVTWPLAAWPVALERDVTKLINGSNDALAFNENISFNAGIGVPLPIDLLVVCIMIEISETIGFGQGSSRLTFEDVDGDGKLDHVLKMSGDPNLYVKLNQTGKANLLKSVTRPLGGGVTLDYQREGNHVDLSDPDARVDMPHNQWVLSSTLLDDGYGNTYQKSFEYFGSGFHDRTEREDYGYAHLRTTLEDGATVEDFFNNQDYYRRGLLAQRIERDATGKLFRLTQIDYDVPAPDLPPITSSFFAGERERRTFLYEGTTTDLNQPGKSTRELRSYDDVGNLTSFIDEGDDGTGDDLHYTIDYHADLNRYIFRPSSLVARDAAGNLLRGRTAQYLDDGALSQLSDTLVGGNNPDTGAPYTGDPTTNPTWHFDYDGFGNLRSAKDPKGYTLTYVFDSDVATYRISTTDSFGYSSSATPDLRFGTFAQTVDVNGNRERFLFDEFGRPTQVFGPYDGDADEPAIAYSYSLPGAAPAGGAPAWALTGHKDVLHPGDPIQSVAFMDGLGRLVQTKKDLERDTGTGTSTQVGFSVSGPVMFDARGRLAEQGQPVFDTSPATAFVSVAEQHATTYTYDTLDRVRAVTAPDSGVTRTDYGFSTLDGVARLIKTVTDPNGKLQTEYRSVREEVLAVAERNTIGGTLRTLVTRYSYDPLEQITQIVDSKQNTTHITYDTAGQMVMLDNPDNGRTEYRYDLGGNLAAKQTANLRARGLFIHYLFHFNRIEGIDYPDSPDVAYTYGDVGATFNRAGRVVTRTDESGTEERFYGKIGEVVKTNRTFTTHTGNGGVSATTEYQYDSFGRLLTLKYPDGELLTYGYDRGGLVQTVSGLKAGNPYNYVAFLGYNEFEQRSRITYGNGVATRYSYDPVMRRIAEIATDAPDGQQLQRLHFGYDHIGTILSSSNDVTIPPPPKKGGPTTQSFQYDDLYQLTHASGSYKFSPNKERRYTLDVTYDELRNVTHKTQNDTDIQPSGNGIVQKPTTYDSTYAYAGAQPHAPSHTGTKTFHYDADGNQTGWDDDNTGQRRTVAWDEENRMSSLADNGQTTTFLYDAEGDRSHKVGMQGETVYANQFYVVRNGQIATKQIFAGDARIASKIVKSSGTGTPVEQFLYFYHPDHLGSSGYVTDDKGQIFQHDEFFPSGETWVEEASNTERTPYLFNGKELDETGLYYYGARYYDPRQSQWVSPDPLFPAFAHDGGALVPGHLNLYAYVLNNPVRFVDRTGREEGDPGDVFISFIPVIGPLRDFRRDVRNGRVGWAIVDAAFLVVDVATLGEGTVVRDVATGGKLFAKGGGNIARGELRAAAVEGEKAAQAAAHEAEGAAKAGEEAAEQASKGPNPYGKKGGPAHQAKVDEIAKDIEERGMEAVREHPVSTPGGQKGKRFVDVAAKDRATGEVKELHQVGRQTKKGLPVSRERKAIEDIEKAKEGGKVQYHPYNTHPPNS